MVKYSWKKTLKKFAIIGAEVLILGLIAYATDNPGLLIFIPLLEAGRNFIKHK